MAEAGPRGQRQDKRGCGGREAAGEAGGGPRALARRRASQQGLALPDLQQGSLQGLGSGPKGKEAPGTEEVAAALRESYLLIGRRER